MVGPKRSKLDGLMHAMHAMALTSKVCLPYKCYLKEWLTFKYNFLVGTLNN